MYIKELSQWRGLFFVGQAGYISYIGDPLSLGS